MQVLMMLGGAHRPIGSLNLRKREVFDCRAEIAKLEMKQICLEENFKCFMKIF